MAPGRLDDGDKWKKLLGDDLPKPKPVPVAALKAGTSSRPSAQPSPKMGAQQRVQRTGAKRSYNDRSFTGYQDTYDGEEESRDMTEDERMQGPLKKKRRKDIPISSGLGQNSAYNVGLMAGGVRQR